MGSSLCHACILIIQAGAWRRRLTTSSNDGRRAGSCSQHTLMSPGSAAISNGTASGSGSSSLLLNTATALTIWTLQCTCVYVALMLHLVSLHVIAHFVHHAYQLCLRSYAPHSHSYGLYLYGRFRNCLHSLGQSRYGLHVIADCVLPFSRICRTVVHEVLA